MTDLPIDITTRDTNVDPSAFLKLAYRDNKKRSHLLVSTILGKHIPVMAHTQKEMATLLARKIVDVYKAADAGYAQDMSLFNRLDLEHGAQRHVLENFHQRASLFAYAETATCLGAYVAQQFSVPMVTSTRYPRPDVPVYAEFTEDHSHATEHYVTLEDVADFNRGILILIDDEASSNNTLINTIRQLHKVHPRSTYIIGTLIRNSNDEDMARLHALQEELRARILTTSLYEIQVTVDQEKAQEGISRAREGLDRHTLSQRIPDVHSASCKLTVPAFYRASTGTRMGEYKGLCQAFLDAVPEDMLDKAFSLTPVTSFQDAVHQGVPKHLVLGVEEDMILASHLAGQLDSSFHRGRFYTSATTQSPALPSDEYGDAYGIRSRYVYHRGSSLRYVYNVDESFSTIIILNSDPDSGVEELAAQLESNGHDVILVDVTYDDRPLSPPLSKEDGFGSYAAKDVRWLLEDLSDAVEVKGVEEREEAVQKGKAHYAETLPVEYQPSKEYENLFLSLTQEHAPRIAELVESLYQRITREVHPEPVFVSLARAGTPIGALLARYQRKYGRNLQPHYAMSIVRGIGMDTRALEYIARRHAPEQVVFVDGWTGKGAITNELREALKEARYTIGRDFTSSPLAVLADPAYCADISATQEDIIIPSSLLNSTVSGLISRTVYNENLLTPEQYHGAKHYAELADHDYSEHFLSAVEGHWEKEEGGVALVHRIMRERGISSQHLIKPGVGEATRILLRRTPETILMRKGTEAQLAHIVALCEEKGVPIEYVDPTAMPYACIGIIKDVTKAP